MIRSLLQSFTLLSFRTKRKPSGQSFVELMLVLVILTMILAGVVEFGFLMNNYLHVLDGAREAARYSSSAIAFNVDTQVTIPEFYYYTSVEAVNAMEPVKLDPTKGDDIVISVLSVSGGVAVRRPVSSGWSLCSHFTDFANYLWAHDPNHPADPLQSVPPGLADAQWYTCTPSVTRLNDADLEGRLISGAPNAGVLLVEVFYNYPQVLKLPVFSNNNFLGIQFSIIPDPIPVYIYSIMPNSSAEPTPGP